MLTRRTLLQALASLPLCGWMKPERVLYGFVDVKRAQALGIYPCKAYDAAGNQLKRCVSFNDITGEVTCYRENEHGDLYLNPDMKTVASVTFTAKLPLRIERC